MINVCGHLGISHQHRSNKEEGKVWPIEPGAGKTLTVPSFGQPVPVSPSMSLSMSRQTGHSGKCVRSLCGVSVPLPFTSLRREVWILPMHKLVLLLDFSERIGRPGPGKDGTVCEHRGKENETKTYRIIVNTSSCNTTVDFQAPLARPRQGERNEQETCFRGVENVIAPD